MTSLITQAALNPLVLAMARLGLCSAFARARPVSILHTGLPWAISLSKPQAGFTFGLGAPGRFWGDVI
jgi:hypothetical protein